jgi:AcrR family transcriptional regulator
MSTIPAAAKSSRKQPAVRSGRPPQARAGEVDERILDAARAVFLERGLAGASIDEIASRARAGKPTIYARYPGKEALFTAVAMRNVAAAIARFENHVPVGTGIEERLTNLGVAILHWVLFSDTTDLMRSSIAEARRFPDLASSVHRMARRRAEETVARLLAETAQSGEFGTLPAFAPEHLSTTTQFFNNLVVLPLMLRALFGENRESLDAEVEPHVARSVAFFLAACRHGSVQ